MKLLPIKIDNKFDYYVDFDSNRAKNINSQDNSEEYIIQDSFVIKKMDGKGTIFDFYPCLIPDYNATADGNNNTEAGVLLLSDGENTDKVVYINELSITQENDNYRIKITLCDSETFLQRFNSLPVKSDNFEVYYENLNTASTVVVTFIYDNKEVTCKFYIAPSQQIWKAVVDSGSEATQIKVFNPDNNGERLELFSYIAGLRFFDDNRINALYSGNNGFIQVEGKYPNIDKTLYKSIYHIKKNVKSKDINNETLVPQKKMASFEDPILMLTRYNDFGREAFMKNYIKLSNLKIASYGSTHLPTISVDGNKCEASNVGDNYYYKKYMSEFCYHILNYIASSVNVKEEKNKNYLTLYVLVPNVYSVLKTRKSIDCIIESINRILSHYDNNFNEFIEGFSVIAVSESDASLIGATNNGTIDLKGNNCLIMDAGKGTLDFSLVCIDNNNNFESIMKNGIVGASAAINYGFILDLLSAYYNQRGKELTENELKARVKEGILGSGNIAGSGDTALLNNLMNAVDKYKIEYNDLDVAPDKKKEQQTNANDDNFSLAAFIEWIEKYRYKVEDRYVNGVIDEIVKCTIEKINSSIDNNIKIDKVLYAGRGFLYEELKKRMNNALQSKFANINEIEIKGDSSELKTMCLNISSAIDSGRYNPICTHQISHVIKKQQQVVKEKKNKFVWLKECLQSLEMKSNIKQKENRKIFKKIYVDTTGNSQIQIGTAIYALPSECKGEATLYISNDKIYLHNNGKVFILEEQLNYVGGINTLLFPSLFPDVNGENIYMPKPSDSTLAQAASDDKTDADATQIAASEDKPDTDVTQIAASEDKTDADVTQITASEDKTDADVTQIVVSEDKTDADATQIAASEDKTDTDVTQIAASDDKTDADATQITASEDKTDTDVTQIDVQPKPAVEKDKFRNLEDFFND